MEEIEELEEWLGTHYGDVIYGGWRGDEPNEAFKKINRLKELKKALDAQSSDIL